MQHLCMLMLHAIRRTSGPRSSVTLRGVCRQLVTDVSEVHLSARQSKNEPWNTWLQNTGPICFLAPSVTNYQPASCYTTEERRRLHRDGSPRSRNTLAFHFIICEYISVCCVEYRISLVVALNLGPFTTVAFNGLVVWGQFMNVQRDWGRGVGYYRSYMPWICTNYPLTFHYIPT